MDQLKTLRDKARGLPLLPGVYLMRDKSGGILYIGKAKALKNRVLQYFTGTQVGKTAKLVSQIQDFDTIVCDSEFEALILECSLIKEYQPKYNILLKDDKGYHYIRVSPPPWRRITAVKQLPEDRSQILGPYNSGFIVTQTVDEACKVFKLPTCTRPLSEKKTGVRPCLRHFIGQCSAPCAGKISLAEYEDSVSDALEYMKGGSAMSVEALTAQMEQAAENLEFERAARLRDRIRAIRRFSEKQKVVDSKIPHHDVVAMVTGPKMACFQILRFKQSKLYDSEFFLIPSPDSGEEARYEFLMRYYSLREEIPPVISIDAAPADEELLSRWLSERAGRRVKLHVPQKGDTFQLVRMCRNNASEQLAQHTGRTGREAAALDELAALLGLPKPPRLIEAYDISHTGGEENVAGLVVFQDGRANRSLYRKFKVKGFSGQDDYASMREVLTRRLTEYENGSEDETFGELPDLILLDGGKGQVSAVREVLSAKELDIPLYGMVKDSRHRTRAVTGDGREIAIQPTRAVYTLISTIQEEVHRFAVGYHHQRRKKSAFSSTLTEIPGVGQTRARQLLRHFGSIRSIRSASVEDLIQVKGMTRPAALQVWSHFHPQEESGPDQE